MLNLCYKQGRLALRCYSGHLPRFTKEQYPNVKRRDFAVLNDKHVKYFTKLLGYSNVIVCPNEVYNYNVDWIKSVRGCSEIVLKPKNTAQVSQILSFCNDERLAVCPQGGNTGLVGGSVPVFDEIVISTSLMNSILDFDEISGVLVCESGCILENMENFTKSKGHVMPIDLGAKGSCQIGGNVSTNAGGLKFLRYGSLHNSVLGLEAVLANGKIIDCLSTLKKDNTGYSLKNIFIGSEGTLGIITKVALQCPIAPKAVNLALIGLNSFGNVLETYKNAKSALGETLSSCEMMDFQSLNTVVTNLNVKMPLDKYPFYMMIETASSCIGNTAFQFEAFVNDLAEKFIICDAIVTGDSKKMLHMWQLRERIAEGLLKEGYVFKYDISLPLLKFYEIVEMTDAQFSRKYGEILKVTGYGHIGDGNLHLNVCCSKWSPELRKDLDSFVYNYVEKHRGSVSAEHGIGFQKKPFLKYSKNEQCINLMKQFKQLFDPNHILNPYKVFDA